MTDLSGLSDAQLMALAQSQGGLAPQQPVQVQAAPPVQGTNSFGQTLTAPGYDQGFDLSHLTDAQLQAMADNASPQMSTAEDIGRSGVTGLEKGGAGFLGAPGDVQGLLGQAFTKALIGGYGGLQDLTGSNLGVPYLGAKNTHRMDDVAGMPFASVPDSQAINSAIQQVAGPYHTPQTTAGSVTERGAEFAPMALLPGGPLARLSRVVLPAGGSMAGEAVAPKGYKDIGALVGAVLGGGVQGVAEGVANAPQRLVGRALSEIDPAALSNAADLQRRAGALPNGGVHITPFEALDQATNGGAKSAMALQHFVENSPVGRKLTAPLFAERPNQLAAAVRGVADTIGPEDLAPSASSLTAQNAATGVLRKFDQMRTSATRPLYKVADTQAVDPAHIEDLRDALTSEIMADKTGKISPVLKQFRDDLAPNGETLSDIKSLDTIRKDWRDRFDLPPNSPDALGKAKAATLQPFLGQLDDLMTSASKAFEQGKALHADISRTVVDPANNGPLGAISNTTDLPTQVRALYPSAPPEGAAVETGTAANLLPNDVVGNLTRHNLVDTWNTANTDLQTGQNQWAGSRLAKAIAGHDEQQKALYNGINALDPSGQTAQQVTDLLDAGRATGKRWAPGSLTAFNSETAKLFNTTPTPVKMATGLLEPFEWGDKIDHAVGGALYRRNVEAVAKVLRMSADEAAQTLRDAQVHGSANPLVSAILLAGPKGPSKP